ncbi:FxSxx-COOH system tetratricopeptide repeat protein [Streptomyces sp. NBC_01537]|uniref:FxSxx-COOH system tetratricopeptide repeat protein n=1 Tax=Streptomyces sp. NBC_01537 TaxID=2903896 RepID=UPI00387049AF
MTIDTLNITVPPLQRPASWPIQVGTLPLPATALQPRTDVRHRIDHAWTSRNTIVLTGGGGVGKSQLAAAIAREALVKDVDLVVWVSAAEPERVIAQYAWAAQRVQAPGTSGQDAESDAIAFLDWLATTPRSWLLVLDDITDPAAMGSWWPRSPSADRGRALVTTRRREAILSGGNRTVVAVEPYAPDEARAYLRGRLSTGGAAHLLDGQADLLVEELGHLPLALSYATAYMINEAVCCTDYLRRLTGQGPRLEELLPPQADTEGYGRHVAAALLLSLDAANSSDPTGLALPAIRLAAYLDPAGHPRTLWTSTAVTKYLSAHRATTSQSLNAAVSPDEAQSTLRLLHRFGLLVDDPEGGHRSVRLHALTARAARETVRATELPPIVMATAYALLEVWPEEDHLAPDLGAVLRANVDTLSNCVEVPRWSAIVHPLLYRYGASLLEAGLYPAALDYWRRLASQCEQSLGKNDLTTLAVRGKLATAFWRAGLPDEAVDIHRQVANKYKRRLGRNHPDTLMAIGNLAVSYRNAGNGDKAIELLECNAVKVERLYGSDSSEFLNCLNNLAAAYGHVGHLDPAIKILESVAEKSALGLGSRAPATLLARSNLGANFYRAGRNHDAIELLEQTVTEFDQVLGVDHPDTLIACLNLASSYQAAGCLEESIAIEERVADARERLLGPDHAETLNTRAALARSYCAAGRIDDGIALMEHVAHEYGHTFGEDHPECLISYANLAVVYRRTGRVSEAIEIQERIAIAFEEIFENGHPQALLARGNLATSYWEAGRLVEAISIEEQVADACERLLGPDHFVTVNAYGNLAVSYRHAGRIAECAAIEERFEIVVE